MSAVFRAILLAHKKETTATRAVQKNEKRPAGQRNVVGAAVPAVIPIRWQVKLELPAGACRIYEEAINLLLARLFTTATSPTGAMVAV